MNTKTTEKWDITWTFDESKLNKPYDGTYFLRIDRTDLSPEQMWQTYVMLTTVEDAFRSLKGELGLRPNFHQRSDRIESHIFITVLAYYLQQWIQYDLKPRKLSYLENEKALDSITEQGFSINPALKNDLQTGVLSYCN